mgnify:FL=1
MKKKVYKEKVCKYSKCREKFTPQRFGQTVCSPMHGIYYAREKKYKEETNRLKSDFYEKDVKTRKAAAKKACHAFIRYRDKDQLCICCNKPLGNDYHAGHFHESGNNPLIRYDENNIHGQRLDCNYFKGGGRSGDYEANLRLKIGNDKVDKINSMKGGTIKRTAKDYREIEVYYKNKLRELQAKESPD